jgi:hypothetical protein
MQQNRRVAPCADPARLPAALTSTAPADQATSTPPWRRPAGSMAALYGCRPMSERGSTSGKGERRAVLYARQLLVGEARTWARLAAAGTRAAPGPDRDLGPGQEGRPALAW